MNVDKTFYVDIIQFKKDKKTIQVYIHNCQLKNKSDDIQFLVNQKVTKYKKYLRHDLQNNNDNTKTVFWGYYLEFTISNLINFSIIKNGKKLKIDYTYQSLLSRLPHCYKQQNGFVFNHNDYQITIKRQKKLNVLIREIRFLCNIKKEYTLKDTFICFIFRTAIRLYRTISQPVILLSDRLNHASDNGEALYKYLDKNSQRKLKLNFLIRKQSLEGQRLKNTGFKIIEPFSIKHFFKFFNCQKIISSSFDEWIYQPFGKYLNPAKPNFFTKMDVRLYFGLVNLEYIFLQHGTIKDDMSKSINKEKQNFYSFIASNNKEAKSLKDLDYHFFDNEIILTGQPRYDYLNYNLESKQKLITIMPTWRKFLLPDKYINGQRAYYSGFKSTEFFKFYNSLLNDKKLLQQLDKSDYQLQFIIHPSLTRQIKDFSSYSKRVILPKPPYNFSKIINQTNIFVTDYSSIFYDFAYTGASIIYSQFDNKTFFINQKYEQPFWTYKNNGLGPITTTVAKTSHEIIKLIKNNGQINHKYTSRYKESFLWHDKNFCQRTNNAIFK
ncbi:MAG: CDP-glycerol glycerophosphotransferase family protein [Bifidobacteriaceae bacterium]|jgi:CDP-glycerol glycerophosphotransferase (TagB/SpsB family)|nr:CDP-glycerol glycerophosphotransferase family protein [Bifidobacteriaceae bacterium]